MSENATTNGSDREPTDPWAEATDTPVPSGESIPEPPPPPSPPTPPEPAEPPIPPEPPAPPEPPEPPVPPEPPAPPSIDDEIRRVLESVAAGDIDPTTAATRLEELRAQADASPAAEPAESGSDAEQPAPPAEAKPVRLRVRAVGRRVKIVGEPFVTTVAVDGPHVVRQDGDTLSITSEGEFGASLDGFTLTPPRSLRDVQQKVFDLGRELSIRVNPSLLVETEVTAGSVNVERVPHLEQVRVTAGSARVRDVEGPIDVLVQAGSAQVEGKISNGRSRLRTESGSLQLRLLKGSSVRIHQDVQLGRVQWEPGGGKESEERVVGRGDARLDLEVMMGAVTVKEAP